MDIAVYCGSNPGVKDEYSNAAVQLGTWIGESGNNLVYGGSAIGLMGAISKAVLAAGGKVFGVEPNFFLEAGVAQHDLTELIEVETMSERKAKMIELADVFVALPGGVGTLEEISEIMSRMRLRMTIGPCYFLNINGFYDGLKLQLEAMTNAAFLDESDFDAFIFCGSVDELCERLAIHEVCEDRDCKPVVPESNILCG